MSVEWVGDEPSPVHSAQRGFARRAPTPSLLMAGIVAAALGIGLIAGVAVGRSTRSHSSHAASTVTVLGTVVIADFVGVGSGTVGASCVGNNDLTDVRSTTPVLVADSSARILAATRLGPGHVTATGCVFPFSVPITPTGATYLVSIADRASVVVPRSQLSQVVIHP